MSGSLYALPQKTKDRIFGWGFEEAAAHWISNVISPPLVGIATVITFVWYRVPNPMSILWWILVATPLICLPPATYVLWLVRKGDLADAHMPDRRSRLKPLCVMIVWGCLSLLILHYWGIPFIVVSILLTILGYMVVLSAITLFWKISFHSTAISAAAGVGIIVTGLTGWSVAAAVLVPLVAWARVYLHRHSFKQVMAGCVAGMSMGLILLL